MEWAATLYETKPNTVIPAGMPGIFSMLGNPGCFGHRRYEKLHDVCIEIAPLWIHGFDEINFPLSFPFFDYFFAVDGSFHRFVNFTPN